MSLVVLSISTRPGHLKTLFAAPGDNKLVHEGAVIVEVYTQQGEGKTRARFLDRHDHVTAVPRSNWNAFGPARGNVGQHHRLHKASRRRGTRMRHKIDLDIAG